MSLLDARHGRKIAVYRFRGGRIAESWFFPDGYDPAALSVVFSVGASA